MKKVFFTLILFCAFYYLNAQNKWSLQQCVDYALKNNLSLKQSEIQIEMNKNNYDQVRATYLPNLNAGANHTYNFGRTIDRYTNTFAESQVLSQNFFISSQFTIWSGLSQLNNIQANKYTWLASKENLNQQKNDLSLNVATAFLQAVYTFELMKVAEAQVKISKEQLERTEKMAEAGTIAKSNVYDVKAQLANDEFTMTSAKNNRKLALLTLQQLLNIDTISNFDIDVPMLDVKDAGMLPKTAFEVYEIALKNQPQIKSAELSLTSSEKTLSAARGRISPSLSMSASIGTGYSGLAKDVVGYNYINDTLGVIPGIGALTYTRQDPILKDTPFDTQVKNNVNKSVGFTLTVPLFNGLSTYTSIRNAKLSVLSNKYSYDLRKQQLLKTIAQAHADAQAAIDKYSSAVIARDAAQQSFYFSEQKFNAGALSAFDYSTAKNRLLRSEADLLNAKFDYIFKMKVLDFYQGKPLVF